jgi:hypothetical protein
MYYCEAFDIISTDEDSGLYTGAKLEGGIGGGGDTPPPPKYESSGLAGKIILIGRAIKDFK